MRRSVGRGSDGADARSQQLVQRADAERAEFDAADPLLRHVPLEPERHLVASGQNCGDRLVSRRDRANRSIASDGASSHWTSSIASRSCLSTASFRKVLRKANATTPSSTVGPSDSESASAASSARRCGRGSCGNTSARTASDQVGQPDERKTRLRFGRSAGKHHVSARPRRLDGGEPQRCLADPGLADEYGGCGQLSGRLEEIEESGELVLPAGEVRNADCHAFRSLLIREPGRSEYVRC